MSSLVPMNKVKERMAKQKAEEEAKEVTDVELLTEIRDLLSAQRGGTGTVTNGPVPGGPNRTKSLPPVSPTRRGYVR